MLWGGERALLCYSHDAARTWVAAGLRPGVGAGRGRRVRCRRWGGAGAGAGWVRGVGGSGFGVRRGAAGCGGVRRGAVGRRGAGWQSPGPGWPARAGQPGWGARLRLRVQPSVQPLLEGRGADVSVRVAQVELAADLRRNLVCARGAGRAGCAGVRGECEGRGRAAVQGGRAGAEHRCKGSCEAEAAAAPAAAAAAAAAAQNS